MPSSSPSRAFFIASVRKVEFFSINIFLKESSRRCPSTNEGNDLASTLGVEILSGE